MCSKETDAAKAEVDSFIASGPTAAVRQWQVEDQDALFEPRSLQSDIECDTAIVGGGITGLASAFRLSPNRKVALLEAGRLGKGSSGWNAGIASLSTTVDMRVVEAELGAETARQLMRRLPEAVERVKRDLNLPEQYWQTGRTIYLAARPSHRKILDSELLARQRYQGMHTERLADAELHQVWRGFKGGIALFGEHAVHPLRLLLAMADAVRKNENGSEVYENTKVRSWTQENGRFVLDCGNHKVYATNLVLSVGIASFDVPEVQELSRQLVPVKGYVLVTEPSSYFKELAQKGVVAMWDSQVLYHYVRYLPDGRVLVGGEEAPGVVSGQELTPTEPHIERLYAWAQAHHQQTLPPIQHCWRASLVIPADGLPLINARQVGKGTLISAVTDGLPSGMLLGEVVSELINSGANKPTPANLMRYRGRLQLATKILAALPTFKPFRRLAYKAAFALIRLWDRYF